MEFFIETAKREEVIDITDKIRTKVKGLLEKYKKLGNKKSKACFVLVGHTSCALWVNEVSDKNLCEDILTYLNKIVPREGWKHNCSRKNASAHIKASLIGSSKIFPVKDGVVQLGIWQRIGLIEFDGPRKRKISIELV